MAYVSNESGRPEVYVRPFQNSSQRWQISNSGGGAPRWRHDGKELFYVASDGRIMAVPLKVGATFEAGSPAVLFKVTLENSRFYDVISDGQRFLLTAMPELSPLQITVVINWTESPKR